MSKLKVLHWSDSHGATTPTNATHRMKNAIEDIDAFIHTGDICYNKFSDSISYAAPFDFMITVGNHDDITDEGAAARPMDWTKQPTQKQLYDKFIAPTISITGIDAVQDKSWWSKEYSDKNCMIIGLNTSTRGVDYTDQLWWLYSKLTYCLENNYSVLIACHYPAFRPTVEDNSWTQKYFFDGYDKHADTDNVRELYPGLPAIYDTVCTFADNGLKVIAWICGHEHPDAFFIAGNQVKFPMVAIGSTLIETASETVNWANDVNRVNDSSSDKCAVMNLYTYDDYLNCLTIDRIGADTVRYGYLRQQLVFDYNTGKVVSILAR